MALESARIFKCMPVPRAAQPIHIKHPVYFNQLALLQKAQTGLRWLRRAHSASDAELYMQYVLLKIKRSSLNCSLSAKKIQDFY